MTYTLDYLPQLRYDWYCTTGPAELYFSADTKGKEDSVKIMKTKIYTAVLIPSMPLGNFRSFPAQLGSAIPSYPIKHSRPLEHPQGMSNAAETQMPAVAPKNDSSLALECPLESPAAPVGQ